MREETGVMLGEEFWKEERERRMRFRCKVERVGFVDRIIDEDELEWRLTKRLNLLPTRLGVSPMLSGQWSEVQNRCPQFAQKYIYKKVG